MKKVLRFLQSMKFGMILLVLLLICSLIGSLIPQGREATYYEQAYPVWGKILLALQFHTIFSSWYFLALLALLCLSLILCSLSRFDTLARMPQTSFSAVQQAESRPITDKEREKLTGFLKARHYREIEGQACKVFYKNQSGFYGSFLVHLSLFLILVFGATSMYAAQYADVWALPGEPVILKDGTQLEVSSFTMEDEAGRVDYVSEIVVTDTKGNGSGLRKISVNAPLSFGGHVFYQQSYAIAGHLTMERNGEQSTIYLTGYGYLKADENSGLIFYAVYPDYTINEAGEVILNPDGGAYENPVYLVSKVEDGVTQDGVAVPGATLTIGDVRYTFHPPIWYPGIRVKTSPAWILALLYASFGLMILGLWLCFFHIPAYVKLDEAGYAFYSPKTQAYTAQQLEVLLRGNTEHERTVL